jgi:methyl-accepting chemotaxis protein
VRSLAQRSAESAKQIKALITSSVELGASLVEEADQTMAELVSGVNRVRDVVGEVTAQAEEQSRGIGEVNLAVAQMDRMTQQNAGLVCRSAKAASALTGQARSLNEAVSAFRIEAV